MRALYFQYVVHTWVDVRVEAHELAFIFGRCRYRIRVQVSVRTNTPDRIRYCFLLLRRLACFYFVFDVLLSVLSTRFICWVPQCIVQCSLSTHTNGIWHHNWTYSPLRFYCFFSVVFRTEYKYLQVWLNGNEPTMARISSLSHADYSSAMLPCHHVTSQSV